MDDVFEVMIIPVVFVLVVFFILIAGSIDSRNQQFDTCIKAGKSWTQNSNGQMECK